MGAGSPIACAPGLLLSAYYVFNIASPAKASNVYFSCEMLIGIEQDAKKRNSTEQVYFSPLRWLITDSSTFKYVNFSVIYKG